MTETEANEERPLLIFGDAPETDEARVQAYLTRLEKTRPGGLKTKLDFVAGFRQRLHTTHGEGLDEMTMLHSSAIEAANWAQDRVTGTFDESDEDEAFAEYYDVVSGLAARTLLAYDEVGWLLRGGYPSAAYARCRTLHELYVTAAVIARFAQPTDEHKLVERYLAHRDVFMTRTARDIDASGMLDPDFFGPELHAALEGKKADLLTTYGRHFGTMWGWAAPLTSTDKPPTIKELSGLVTDGLDFLYSLTSDHTHASSAAWHESFVQRGDQLSRTAGPTNLGLSVPAALSGAFLLSVLEIVIPTRIEAKGQEADDTGAMFMAALTQMMEHVNDAMSASERLIEEAEEQYLASLNPEAD